MAWKELAILVGVLVAWFGLMRFVLPALGVPTCMSGACQTGPSEACPLAGRPSANDQTDNDRTDNYQADNDQSAAGIEKPAQADPDVVREQP